MSFNRSSTYDSLVDHYVQVMIVSPVDYFILDYFSGSSCGDTPHWGIFPFIIPSHLGIQIRRLFTVMAFRATLSPYFKLLESPYIFQFGIQSHWLAWRSNTSIFFQFGI